MDHIRKLRERAAVHAASRLGYCYSNQDAELDLAVADALASSSASGAEQMREMAAKVAHVEDGLVPKGRAFQGNADYGPRVAERIEALIRALPLPNPAPVPAWRPIETAPKDKPILAWCDHEADPYELGDGKLTLYAGHAEGMSHASTGWHIIEWGGGWDDNTHEYSGGWMPDWWFVVGSEFEVAANPIGWMPLPPPPQTGGHDDA